MTIGRRMTATATVPLRKVREATADALETLEQHAGVINGQGEKLKALGKGVADATKDVGDLAQMSRSLMSLYLALVKRVDALEAAQRQAAGLETA